MPRFSVVVPAYNATGTLAETLDAVFAQEFEDWECVVVDDGSTDDSASIVEEYCRRDDRFHLIRQQNAGTAGAYRTGLAAAEADLLVICAADDLLLPEHLEVMDEFIAENPEYEIYSSNGEYFDHESRTRRVVYVEPEWQRERSLSFEQLVANCFFSVGAVFRRQVLDTTGGHRAGVYVDDYDLWLRAMMRGARHRYTPRILSVHRVSDFQQTANLPRVFESNVEVLENLLTDASIQPTQRAVVEERIRRERATLSEYPTVLALEQQAQRLRRTVERLFGVRRAEPVMRVIHAVSWAAKPARRFVARLRAGAVSAPSRAQKQGGNANKR